MRITGNLTPYIAVFLNVLLTNDVRVTCIKEEYICIGENEYDVQ